MLANKPNILVQTVTVTHRLLHATSLNIFEEYSNWLPGNRERTIITFRSFYVNCYVNPLHCTLPLTCAVESFHKGYCLFKSPPPLMICVWCGRQYEMLHQFYLMEITIKTHCNHQGKWNAAAFPEESTVSVSWIKTVWIQSVWEMPDFKEEHENDPVLTPARPHRHNEEGDGKIEQLKKKEMISSRRKQALIESGRQWWDLVQGQYTGWV